MTEEGAKKKCCPMFQVFSSIEKQKCIASDCMMWRWSTSFDDGTKTPRATFGYCGLGGKT